ncbi:hypothetical protein AMJ86_00510 [bacterium SM23_57]|nr:MAG: hypothetical protein AMJ86_00510 [bacterium SM23_57]
MQAFIYSLKEGLSGLRRAKLSCLLSITTIAISLILIGGVFIITLNMYQIVSSIRERMELEVFIDNSIADDKIKEIQESISSVYGVKQVAYISKEQAAEDFQKEFKLDVMSVLDENPLPASFRISLIESFRTSSGADSIVQVINKLPYVDEIVYHNEFIKLIDRYIFAAVLTLLIAGSIVCIGSIFFVYNNIRLVIFSRQQLISLMKLVGATPGFIRLPFVVEGIIQAVFGVAIAIGVLYGIYLFINKQLPAYTTLRTEIFGILFILSILLGVIGSTIAVKRFLKY